MEILFLGAQRGTARHRVEALRRLGHRVVVVDPESLVSNRRAAVRLNYETGGILIASQVRSAVLNHVPDRPFDFTWVDQGRLVGPKLVKSLQTRFGPVVVHNLDGPFGHRDRLSWLLFRKAVPNYDLVVVPRRSDIDKARAHGARQVKFMFRTADEVAHAPRVLSKRERSFWNSEVTFLGTAIPREGRGAFMLRLIEKNVPVSIRGNAWQRLPEWPYIKSAWKGFNTNSDEEYSAAILASRICLGLLSWQNDDLHTTRSAEIPALGGLLCAQRTADHCEMYNEGREAAFWSSADECAEVCLELLADEARRARMAAAGRNRCLSNGHYNEVFFRTVLAEAFH